ncbi:MAG: hypothetical protein K8R59_13375, partial [Thermoanaerobaculales bacterium]|nr:hypothetical protein [Thermoanaerobaculales bacterium]
MKVRVFGFIILALTMVGTGRVCAQDAIIIDHTNADLASIPPEWINRAVEDLLIGYSHTSHGSQLVSGIDALAAWNSDLEFPMSWWGADPGVFLNDYWANAHTGDLGHNGDLAWRDATRTMLNRTGNDRNVVIWSWCGGVSDNTVGGIQTYLDAMHQL